MKGRQEVKLNPPNRSRVFGVSTFSHKVKTKVILNNKGKNQCKNKCKIQGKNKGKTT